MDQTLDATFDGAVFRPLEAVDLKPDTHVRLTVSVPTNEDRAPVSFLQVAKELRLSGPEDWSDRLDDYLYGGVGDEAE